MNIDINTVINEDINVILSDKNIPWNNLNNCTVLITGATGLVGSALINALYNANVKFKLNMRLIGHGRNINKGQILSQVYGIVFITGDIRCPIKISDKKIDYIFHCAAVTKSSDMIAKPIDVITTEIDGTKNILQLAKEKNCKSIVYLSSMEVYGQIDLKEIDENDLGYLDLSNPRNCYPESKRLCEMMCIAYATQYNLPVKIARLAQTFGAGTPKDDTRVFAQFARNAISGKDIELHTEGKSRGNYCYISDTIRGLFIILLKGKIADTYNISNPAASVTIREMAELVVNSIHNVIKITVNIPEDIYKRGYAPDSGFILKSDKLNMLGWVPKYGLVDMYRRMIKSWEN
jgi:nucleoside-diphosphate-sugar epimerase